MEHETAVSVCSRGGNSRVCSRGGNSRVCSSQVEIVVSVAEVEIAVSVAEVEIAVSVALGLTGSEQNWVARSSTKGMSNVTWGYRLWGINSDQYYISVKTRTLFSEKVLEARRYRVNYYHSYLMVHSISGKKTGVPKERDSRRTHIKTRLELQFSGVGFWIKSAITEKMGTFLSVGKWKQLNKGVPFVPGPASKLGEGGTSGRTDLSLGVFFFFYAPESSLWGSKIFI